MHDVTTGCAHDLLSACVPIFPRICEYQVLDRHLAVTIDTQLANPSKRGAL